MLTKHPKANLRSNYTVFFEIGLIASLLVMIAATRAHIESTPPVAEDFICYDCDFKTIELPPNTIEKNPPAPPRPQVPIPVSDDQLIEDIIEFPDFDFNTESLPLPPPPSLEDEEELMDYIGVEIKPEMKGGMQGFYTQLTYPKVAKIAGIQGRVVVQFVVDKEGNVTNPVVLRGIGGGCDEEVLRVLKLTKFSPAIQNGRFVPVKMTQNVRFSLQN